MENEDRGERDAFARDAGGDFGDRLAGPELEEIGIAPEVGQWSGLGEFTDECVSVFNRLLQTCWDESDSFRPSCFLISLHNESGTSECRGTGDALVFQHHSIGVADVLLEFFDCRSLAENAGYLWQSANKPPTVFPVLKL
jgi:hypothetical protein